MKLKNVFEGCRIAALAGEKSSGKTNNLVSLIVDYRKKKPDIPIYVYGMPKEVMIYLKKLDVEEISSLRQLVKKKNCILILDQFEKLKLNDRRYKDELAEFADYVYHNNVVVILCSPNLREFNSVIGSVIEKWLLKSVRLDECVRGSQLKKVIEDYKGSCKSLSAIDVPLNELLVINDVKEIVIKCDYIAEVDTKKTNIDLFSSCRA